MAVLFSGLAGAAYGLEPDELLLIVNRDYGDGLRIADYYVTKRDVPRENIVFVHCPRKDSISRQEYERKIVGPVKRALQMPGWAVRIRCLLLVDGIPLKITGAEMSHKERLSALKVRERIKALDQIIESPESKPESRRKYRKEKKELKQRLSVLNHHAEAASVDSELSLVKSAGSYRLNWWVPNPLYLPARGRNRGRIRPSQVLMVSRLDGPDTKTVFRMIDDSLFAEKNGLRGTACFDCRYPRIPDRGLSAYQLYDKWLREAADITRQMGLKTVLDTRKALFQPGSCPDAVLYCGWYSLAKYVDAFTWRRGAVAYHIASGECTSLHGKGRQWCPMLLRDGVCVTLGPVAEPYLRAFPPPQLFFRLLFDSRLTIAEIYMLSCPFLSWQIVLLADPLYRPGLALSK